MSIVNQLAKEYKAQLLKLYGSELAELILFGSYAKGTNNMESDVDFAVILNNPNMRPSSEIPKTSFINSRLSLKYGLSISTLFASLHKKETTMQGIYQEIRKTGKII